LHLPTDNRSRSPKEDDVKKLMLVITAALLYAAPAQAKELLGAQLCGPGGCVTERQAGMMEGRDGPFGGALAAPAKPGPWYQGYLLAGDQGKVVGTLPFYYVPGSGQIVQPGRLGSSSTWTRPDAKLAALVERLAARTKPFAVPDVTSVTLNGTKVTDPQSYLRLWTIGGKPKSYPDGLDSQQVIFFSDPASPWSDGNYVVAYPKSHLLLRDGQLVSLPDSVASRLAAGRSLDTGRTIPWTPIAAAIAVLVLAAAVIRRRPRPGAAPQPVAQA
jgi:hypothetical protein